MPMVRAGSSPGGSGPASTPIWLLPPVLLAACTAVAVSLSPSTARSLVVWIGVVATAAVAVAAWQAACRGRALDELRREYADREAILHRHLSVQEAETVRMAKKTLPAAI